VSSPLRGFRVSSARRQGRGSSLVIVATAAVAVLAVVLAILEKGEEDVLVETPFTAIPTPIASATPSPTATVLVEETSNWVVAESPEITPTPWPTAPPPPTRRPPTPTPRIAECVDYRWSAVQVFSPSAQVKVEISAVNSCNRDIGPLDLFFEITGWREGARVQTVRGHPFDAIRRRHSGVIVVGLPGSIDWYDRISVEIVD
jgi:hypothetical protein